MLGAELLFRFILSLHHLLSRATVAVMTVFIQVKH